MGCVRGIFVGLEYKATSSSRVDPLQRLKLSRIIAAGGYAAIVFPENANEILGDLLWLANRPEYARVNEWLSSIGNRLMTNISAKA